MGWVKLFSSWSSYLFHGRPTRWATPHSVRRSVKWYVDVELKSRNDLIAKLGGSSWGASASTLCTSALALCYSVPEYCCPVWARSSHINLIDTQLHSSMHLISGCLQAMQLSWLPVLSNVAPPLCRKAATDNTFHITEDYPNWPVYADVFEHPPPRLASRWPVWSDMTSVDTITLWREDWSPAYVVNHTTVTSSTIRQPGFDLYHHTWSLMNRFRTGQGPCRAQMGSRPITYLWLWPVTDHEPHSRHVPINKIWRWTESTPGSDTDIWLESTVTAALAK